MFLFFKKLTKQINKFIVVKLNNLKNTNFETFLINYRLNKYDFNQQKYGIHFLLLFKFIS
jgi:hypothetical protein